MRRREVMAGLAVAAGWPFGARAQQRNASDRISQRRVARKMRDWLAAFSDESKVNHS